jgi:hypothetical protein
VRNDPSSIENILVAIHNNTNGAGVRCSVWRLAREATWVHDPKVRSMARMTAMATGNAGRTADCASTELPSPDFSSGCVPRSIAEMPKQG